MICSFKMNHWTLVLYSSLNDLVVVKVQTHRASKKLLSKARSSKTNSRDMFTVQTLPSLYSAFTIGQILKIPLFHYLFCIVDFVLVFVWLTFESSSLGFWRREGDKSTLFVNPWLPKCRFCPSILSNSKSVLFLSLWLPKRVNLNQQSWMLWLWWLYFKMTTSLYLHPF